MDMLLQMLREDLTLQKSLESQLFAKIRPVLCPRYHQERPIPKVRSIRAYEGQFHLHGRRRNGVPEDFDEQGEFHYVRLRLPDLQRAEAVAQSVQSPLQTWDATQGCTSCGIGARAVAVSRGGRKTES
jgi:hypothetical protein